MNLINFWNDKETKEAVKAYLIQHLTEEAVKRVFAKEPVEAIGEAREVIEGAFNRLDEMFEKRPEPNVENEAR